MLQVRVLKEIVAIVVNTILLGKVYLLLCKGGTGLSSFFSELPKRFVTEEVIPSIFFVTLSNGLS